MNAHALTVLEFDKVKALLARHAVTELGKELAFDLAPFRCLDRVREAQAETTEMRRCLDLLKTPPLEALADIRPLLERAAPEGNLLEAGEIFQIHSALIISRRTKKFFADMQGPVPRLKELASNLHDFERLESEISKTIDERGEVRDSASRELLRIRKTLRQERSDLVRRIEKFMQRPEIRKCLQENFYTVRENRYVLPIQSKFKNKIKGLIHDVSDSGETAFIEPIQFVDQGNRIRDLEVSEEREVRRVLIQTTSLIRHDLTEIRVALNILAHLDLTLAKAKYSIAGKMEEPRVTDGETLRIDRGRHPILIERLGDKVVPMDIEIHRGSKTLVVTGPNTGGKTVVLKTVASLLLMAWSGMHVPAEGETELPLLDDIYADIGDEQSLEQSLSTFSSHITQIRNIIQAAKPRTLVLLDELGAGTDPVEGGALGRAILKELAKIGCLVLVTTHLPDIKLFAYITDGVSNGAMEFDEASLQPTYRLLMNSTGSSNALKIAERLGMPMAIVEGARNLLDVDSDDAALVLRQLEETLADAAQHERRRREEFDKVRSLREELQRKQTKVERDRQEILNRSRLEARTDLEKLRKKIRESEEELRDLNQAAKLTLERLRETREEETRERLSDDLGDFERKIEQARETRESLEKDLERSFVYQPPKRTRVYEPKEIPVGGFVTVEDFSQPAEVVAIDERKGTLLISVASMEMTIPLTRVVGVYSQMPGEAPVKERSRISYAVESVDVPYELDIHGLTVDEALPKIQGYIDAAAKAGIDKVIIVHGRGRGVLRDVVRQELSRSPVIRSYEPGGYHEGGDGVTIGRLTGA